MVQSALVVIIAGTLLRASMPTAALVVIATVPLGIGIAVIGLSLPALVKGGFASRLGAATGAYTASQALGATAAALSMVPLSHALGGWRGAFAVSVLPTMIAVPLWLLMPRSREDRLDEPPPRAGRLRRPNRQGVLLALVFGLQ